MSPAERIMALEAEIAWLKGLLTSSVAFLPEAWKLSPSQARLVGALLARDVSSFDVLASSIWRDSDEPDDEIACIRVMIANIRRKLAPFGIRIVCHWGVGYRLDPPRKTIVLNELKRAA